MKTVILFLFLWAWGISGGGIQAAEVVWGRPVIYNMYGIPNDPFAIRYTLGIECEPFPSRPDFQNADVTVEYLHLPPNMHWFMIVAQMYIMMSDFNYSSLDGVGAPNQLSNYVKTTDDEWVMPLTRRQIDNLPDPLYVPYVGYDLEKKEFDFSNPTVVTPNHFVRRSTKFVRGTADNFNQDGRNYSDYMPVPDPGSFIQFGVSFDWSALVQPDTRTLRIFQVHPERIAEPSWDGAVGKRFDSAGNPSGLFPKTNYIPANLHPKYPLKVRLKVDFYLNGPRDPSEPTVLQILALEPHNILSAESFLDTDKMAVRFYRVKGTKPAQLSNSDVRSPQLIQVNNQFSFELDKLDVKFLNTYHVGNMFYKHFEVPLEVTVGADEYIVGQFYFDGDTTTGSPYFLLEDYFETQKEGENSGYQWSDPRQRNPLILFLVNLSKKLGTVINSKGAPQN